MKIAEGDFCFVSDEFFTKVKDPYLKNQLCRYKKTTLFCHS
ncbi:hypothetical protein HMPREF7215_0683 [Pyramidobacter piscolens W5455]|uniref:Uncharacterized protein n=1 Tax=Pyramidobacter piscolens W5455 TaxID=352165 RepID=A0ABM9ZVY2_9BACT|nr:hypothetical protein HMPREF7215_0683 [Pyramidobacter piscolens W5455]